MLQCEALPWPLRGPRHYAHASLTKLRHHFRSGAWSEAVLEQTGYHVAITLGLLLGVSLIGGLLGSWLRLPKVTSYLLVGLLLGPSVANTIPKDHVEMLDPVLKLAMALVLFRLGTRFSFLRLRRQLVATLPILAGDILATVVLVTIALAVAGHSLSSALLLGCLAIATAPATTILVLQEIRSEGPVTDRVQLLVALNNLACIVSFELVFAALEGGRSDQGGAVATALLHLSGDLVGSLLLGILGGLCISYACSILSTSHWLVLLVSVTTLVLGIAETTHFPYMLSFLVMGVLVANASDVADRIAEELDHMTGLLCVLFFSVHGAELDLDAMRHVGLAGVVYLAARVAGKVLGNYWGAKIGGEPRAVRCAIGPSLLAQAGAAIALASLAESRDPKLGEPILQIILGSVVVFEIAGPLLIRRSLLLAGEIPLAQAIPHHDRRAVTQWQMLWDRLQSAWRRAEANGDDRSTLNVPIQPLIRRNVHGIPRDAKFDDVIDTIVHSRDNTYPVVDADRSVVGLIRYPLLANVMFDPKLGDLVLAEDLATPAQTVLYENATLEAAAEAFQRETDDCLPVVTLEPPHRLVGVLRRSDVMHLLVRRRKKT